MSRNRPVLVIVLAVLQLVFGTLSVCMPIVLLSGGLDALAEFQDGLPQGPQRIRQADMWEGVAQRLPWFPAYMKWANVASLVLSVLMIVGAVGLLRLQPWGWRLTVAWAIGSLTIGLVGLVLMTFYINPAMSESYQTLLEQMPPPPPNRPDLRPILAQSMRGGQLIGIVTGLAVLCYPAVLLIVTCLPSVRNAYGSRPAGPVEPR